MKVSSFLENALKLGSLDSEIKILATGDGISVGTSWVLKQGDNIVIVPENVLKTVSQEDINNNNK